MDLRKTLKTSTDILRKEGIPHALIGGFALAHYGVFRTTQDIDLLVDGTKKSRAKDLFQKNGFNLIYENDEVLQFSGPGFVDLLLANRPMSQEMLKNAISDKGLEVYILKAEDIMGLKIQAYKNDPTRELQDLADIQSLISNVPNLDWSKIQKYAELFNEWEKIKTLKK